MKAYSMDLRERVIAASDQGKQTGQVAKLFDVSESWVRRLKQHRRERGNIIPRTGGGSRGQKFDRDRLGQLVDEKPDATLEELRDRLGVKVSIQAISKALRRLKLTYKKSRFTPPSRIVRTWRRRGLNGE
jgi:transposase